MDYNHLNTVKNVKTLHLTKLSKFDIIISELMYSWLQKKRELSE
jgi:hypothetical protein